ncbi:MAG: 16S rRNA (uracil(1498)-N(3))-methyltransferase [Clostridia bacterium]|nr:16S rRNA (uracil(1498)-N(3))-methyltransferase [Clostridia bacterium]MBR6553181.1 16S rRNA (uracil(1498)-N(3))-methyltransferase [Clostridia bacterium]
MAFIPRLFLTPAEITPGQATVTNEMDINHVKNVLRISVGGKVTICNGEGIIYPGVIKAFGEGCMEVALGEGVSDTSELPFGVTVYQCYPKGEKAETVVQKAVELGATEIVFVMSSRCVARPDEKSMEKKLVRLQRIADSAAAQSGRCVLPEVRGLISYKEACAEAAKAGCAFLCYEGEGTLPVRSILEEKKGAESYAFLIGPEGGISPEEVQIAKDNGLSLAGLGGRILRTETAALFVLSAVNVLCE